MCCCYRTFVCNSFLSYSTITVRLTHESVLLDHVSVLEVAFGPLGSSTLGTSLVVVGGHLVSGRRFGLGSSGGTFSRNLLLSDGLLLAGHGGGRD